MASLPRNADVADAFDALADVSEILGEQGFRVLAYRRAATRIRETGSSIAELAVAGRAKELPGIGATIEAKIVELEAMKGTLLELINACLGDHRPDCPILEDLAGKPGISRGGHQEAAV